MSSTVSGPGVMTPHTLSKADSIKLWLNSSRGGIDTPIYTATSSDVGGTVNGSFGLTCKSNPYQDGKYLIYDVSCSRVLSCYNGYLRLEPMDLGKPQSHVSEQAQWQCSERNGFRGFKNVAKPNPNPKKAGTFLGHDIWWDFYAKVYHHKGWEDFTLCHVEGGVYQIQSLDFWTQRQVSAKEDGNGLFRDDDGGTLWEFIKVASPRKAPDRLSYNDANGVAGDYTRFPSVSPQPHYTHGAADVLNPDRDPERETVFDEDCLYVNIWVPAQSPSPDSWQVQFYIHSGWLQVGDANHMNMHDPIFLMQEFPRIIVAPAYRLNLFGFMQLWLLDQRAALEWTYANITEFGGNPENSSLGGLSAGRSIDQKSLLTLECGWSSAEQCVFSCTRAQVDELLAECVIPIGLCPQGKFDGLRQAPSETLIRAVHRMKRHTFRAGTDGDFVNASFLAGINSGKFGKLLANQGVDIMLGEVAGEATLYRMVNPASDYNSLVVQLSNYYPEQVTKALLHYYTLPTTGTNKDEWADIGSIIIGDCHVHATIRGFTASLLKTMPEERVLGYRISGLRRRLTTDSSPVLACVMPLISLFGGPVDARPDMSKLILTL
ncbi:dynamin family [Fusarium mundagurra]|uniref:Dynamin family n=1 Tax=Fusarium mundagurra TaxID=1567541 RepID=A0A8H6DM48_9HYPO|nr:dynamin family [Fusarium mundagurra]